MEEVVVVVVVDEHGAERDQNDEAREERFSTTGTNSESLDSS